jgi:antitoxin component YwqK of YwqJK toxin-antitoxin module
MEMVSMAHRVLFRNSIFIVLALTACTQKNNHGLMINTANKALHLQQGTLLYSGKPFTGSTCQLYPNGNTASICVYENGKENGWKKGWYMNKQLAEERWYEHGRKEGVHKGWWENGKPKFVYEFENDEHNGEAKEWFLNGKVSRLFHYEKGHEEGAEKMWWEDGSVRANYVVKKGERFGLIGQKLCKNNVTDRTE